MKIKTSELIGPPLDWAVAVANGHDPKEFIFGRGYHDPAKTHIVTQILVSDGEGGAYDYSPSTSGDTVIEIMEREKIMPRWVSAGKWHAEMWPDHCAEGVFAAGPTVRIAVCRAFVASKLGDEVDVPEELMKCH